MTYKDCQKSVFSTQKKTFLLSNSAFSVQVTAPCLGHLNGLNQRASDFKKIALQFELKEQASMEATADPHHYLATGPANIHPDLVWSYHIASSTYPSLSI